MVQVHISRIPEAEPRTPLSSYRTVPALVTQVVALPCLVGTAIGRAEREEKKKGWMPAGRTSNDYGHTTQHSNPTAHVI